MVALPAFFIDFCVDFFNVLFTIAMASWVCIASALEKGVLMHVWPQCIAD